MRKKVLFLLASALLVSPSFATVEDSSLIDKLKESEPQSLEYNFSLQKFSSCENMETVMENYIKTYWKHNKGNFGRRDIMYETTAEMSFAKGESIENAAELPLSGGGNDDFSKTNTQVQGVDESDIVKTDGKYIYYYAADFDPQNNYHDRNKKYVYIASVADKKVVKKIKVPAMFNNPVLYLGDNTLTIVSGGYVKTKTKKRGYLSSESKTFVVTYDISDVNKLQLTKLYVADGHMSKSRKIGDYVYLISTKNFDIPFYSFKTEDDIQISGSDLVPNKIELSRTTNTKKQNLRNLPYNLQKGKATDCNEIEYILPDEKTLKEMDFDPAYNVISIIDVQNPDKEATTKVIVGNTDEIYMSLDNLYITSGMYQSQRFACPANARCIMPYYDGGTNTLIHKMNIDKNKLSYQDSTVVPGRPLTQYSMDEYKGNFRILTQTEDWNNEDVRKYTGLYILDKNLKLRGKLENLGNNENFKSSRYIGDKLFLVTFRDVDPFFVIDVANPAKPKVLGELKIPGYSTYLHPYDENHIIGLGYDAGDNGHGGVYNGGVKVDLYEINYDKKVGISSDCGKYMSPNCPAYCERDNVCVSSSCHGEICTDDCGGPAVCVPKQDASKAEYIEVKQLHTKTFGGRGSNSEALHNPRMFMWNAAKGKLLLPVELEENDEDDKYTIIDYFQGMMLIDIDKKSGITTDYAISHFDMKDLEEKRKQECSKYEELSEKKCRTLLNGEEYCGSTSQKRVPEYCFEDSNIGVYIAQNRWKLRDKKVNRALWIGNNVYSISDSLILGNNLETGKETAKIELKK